MQSVCCELRCVTMCAVYNAVSDNWLSCIRYVVGGTFRDVYQELMDMRTDPHFAPTVVDAGPNCGRPASMMCNPSASCPEYTRQEPDKYMDTCAHDMWGVGYLSLRVLGNLTPWSLNATASAEEKLAIICAFHEVWVCSLHLPRAAMLVCGRLHYLHAYLWCHAF